MWFGHSQTDTPHTYTHVYCIYTSILNIDIIYTVCDINKLFIMIILPTKPDNFFVRVIFMDITVYEK